MAKVAKTFLYVECDPVLPLNDNADPALDISESSGVDNWPRLSTRFRIDETPPAKNLTTFRLFHQEVETQWHAEAPESDHEIKQRRVRVPQFAVHMRHDSAMYFQCRQKVVRKILRRLRLSHDPLYMFRTRQVDLQKLEDRIKQKAATKIGIKLWELTDFMLRGVSTITIAGHNLDEVEYLDGLVERSRKEVLKFDIESNLGNARITVKESGEMVMNLDIGIGPMLAFVDWLDGEVAACSQLVPMKVNRA